MGGAMKLTKTRAVVIAVALNNLKYTGLERCDSREQANIHYELIDRIENEVKAYLLRVNEHRSLFDIIRDIAAGRKSIDELLKRRVVERGINDDDKKGTRSNKLIDVL